MQRVDLLRVEEYEKDAHNMLPLWINFENYIHNLDLRYANIGVKNIRLLTTTLEKNVLREKFFNLPFLQN